MKTIFNLNSSLFSLAYYVFILGSGKMWKDKTKAVTFSFDDVEMPTVDEIKDSLNPDLVNIINYHVPYNWEEFSSLGFDIQLSGHTHGGQFYPAVWFADLLFRYNMGLFKNDFGKYLHVTTGVGSMDPPMRWGTDSEIVVLKLRK